MQTVLHTNVCVVRLHCEHINWKFVKITFSLLCRAIASINMLPWIPFFDFLLSSLNLSLSFSLYTFFLFFHAYREAFVLYSCCRFRWLAVAAAFDLQRDNFIVCIATSQFLCLKYHTVRNTIFLDLYVINLC